MTDPHDQDPDDREPIGSVAEEATKLFGALADWAQAFQPEVASGVAGLGEQVVRAAGTVDEHLATGAPECTYCPICRTVHLVRRTSPEVRAHLSAAASSLLQAAAGALATQVPQGRPRESGVEHIDLDDETDLEGER
ncbi:hypothetical protein [Nocardioides ferulae]|uniref:hypothetical protein n=1 Tax=Nocardioides ferulae TaxID=2340821 RepID=UPI000EB37B26|nr:hypothetical protein [Nocardioides ferulae]